MRAIMKIPYMVFIRAAQVLIFSCLMTGLVVYRNFIERVKADWNSRIKDKEDIKRSSSDEFKKLENLDDEIKEREGAIVNLYDITKKMSKSLTFDGIFNILSAFLKENFVFRKSELIILKESQGKTAVDKIYKVWEEDHSDTAKSAFDYERLLRFSLENRREAFLRREDMPELFEELGIDEGVKTFVSVPLVNEDKFVAILTAENLPHIDFERFVILAMQFSLEMKKVLLYETVENLAITDSLTGLYVRRYFFDRLNEEINRSRRYKFKFSFIMMDIDDFKRCNDSYGHLVGDVVLKDIGRIMKQSVREIDLVARYGGEEFSLALPETARADAYLVAERIRKRIEDFLFRAYDETLKVTISAGVSVYPDDAAEAKDLVDKADKALYTAKRSGKNLVYAHK